MLLPLLLRSGMPLVIAAESPGDAPAPGRPIPNAITVGSELDYPPFALVTADREADGFTVELWKAVAHQAGLESTIQTGPFHEILDRFKKGDIDVMINLAQSEERRKFCHFAVPHVTMYGALFVRKGDRRVRSDADVADRELIVLNRDLAHDYAIGRGWTNHLVLVDDTASGLALLASGRHDAMLVGKLVGLNTLREQHLDNVEALPGRIGFQQKFAFAVMRDRPGSTELLARINEGLALVQASGVYDTLYEKWFGILEPRRITFRQIAVYLVPFLLVTALVSAAYAFERRLRLRLKQGVALLNATLEATEDGILAVDATGRVSKFNQRLVDQRLFDPGRNGVGDAAYAAVFLPLSTRIDEAEAFRATLERLSRSRDAESSDTLRLADGRCFEVVSKVQHLDGTGAGRVWSFRDVTRREQAAEQIRRFNAELEVRVRERTLQLEAAGRELQRLSNVAATTLNGVVICDPDGRIEWVNHGFESISEWRLPEVVGRRPGEFLQGVDTDPAVAAAVHDAIEARRPIRFTILNYKKSGRPYWIEADINPVFDHEGKLISFVSVQTDITERKAAEEQLRRQREMLLDLNAHLEQAIRSREGFLASMSHELRTPLHGVLGFTELLATELHGPLNDKQRRLLGQVEESANHLLTLITDILDLAKFRAQSAVLDRETCRLAEVGAECVRQIEAAARNKGLRIEFDLDPPGLQLRADPKRLRQVLGNLLDNAVKFTLPGGRIGLRIRRAGDEVQAEVWDTGIGIPVDGIAKLFQPFVQLDSRLAREHNGAGLGLAMARQIVDAHGGRIEVQSELGRGSSFTAIFPLEAASGTSASATNLLPSALARQPGAATVVASPPEARPAVVPELSESLPPEADSPAYGPYSLAGVRVLVAEDNAVNLFAIRMFLEARGAEVLVSENGVEAVALAESANPDIVIMDIQMPKMDGIEATRRIRALPSPSAAAVPIVALTALTLPGDRERCLAAGCNAYLPKPISLRKLVDLMLTYTPKPS